MPVWYRPMVARSVDEPHRSATNLELFFDLCFVVAVAVAADRLHHDLSEDHVGAGVVSYLLVFFAIWWAWMNFTWFASAYDNDDVPYRLTTLVQIAGALVIAAGVSRAFDEHNFFVITVGYVIMRLALVTQWLRAVHGDPPRRQATIRYAVGVTLVQLGWLARLALPTTEFWFLAGFLLLVLLDIAVPIWAERSVRTTWHRHHIAERYGLFTLIVLGECVLAATLAVQSALGSAELTRLTWLAIAGLVIVFSMWWLYFDRPAERFLTSFGVGIYWGYGHYLIFSSVAAVGAGLAVAVDNVNHASHLPGQWAALAVAVPVATFLASVWALQVKPHRPGAVSVAYPVAAGLVIVAGFVPASIQVIAAVLAALVVMTMVAGHRESLTEQREAAQF